MTNKTYTPGQIVTMAGIEFVVLGDFGEISDGSRVLFLLAIKSQGQSKFGDNNNYEKSNLRNAVDIWLAKLGQRINREYIIPRTIDLTTLDGCNGFGTLKVDAAPLTLDEARKYAEVMPDPDEACWLATGWGGPEHFGSAGALRVDSNGGWHYDSCSGSYGVRPALIAPSSILDEEIDDKPDLSGYTTDELLVEVRRRMEDK